MTATPPAHSMKLSTSKRLASLAAVLGASSRTTSIASSVLAGSRACARRHESPGHDGEAVPATLPGSGPTS